MSASTPSSHVRQQSLTGKSATGFPTAQSEHTAPEQDQEEEEDVDMQMDQQVEQPALTEQQQQTEIESSGTANVRAPSRSIYVPIVYGTMSWWMGNPDPNSEKQHSHRWKAYVRGADGRDISYAVRSVIFKLHPSYTNTDREVTTPPFELEETGWGQFDLTIKICFHDLNAKPVVRKHTLLLYNNGEICKDAPVVSETYDEIVFNDLHTFSPSIREQVIRGPKKQEEEHEGQEYHKEFSPEEDLRAIAQAHAFVTAETERLRERLARADAESEALSADIMKLGGSPTDYLSDVVTHRIASQVSESLARQEAG